MDTSKSKSGLVQNDSSGEAGTLDSLIETDHEEPKLKRKLDCSRPDGPKKKPKMVVPTRRSNRLMSKVQQEMTKLEFSECINPDLESERSQKEEDHSYSTEGALIIPRSSVKLQSSTTKSPSPTKIVSVWNKSWVLA